MDEILAIILVLISILWNGYNSYLIFEHKLDRLRHTSGKNAWGQEIPYEGD